MSLPCNEITILSLVYFSVVYIFLRDACQYFNGGLEIVIVRIGQYSFSFGVKEVTLSAYNDVHRHMPGPVPWPVELSPFK